MKKKILFGLLVMIGLFMITGCGNNTVNNEKNVNNKTTVNNKETGEKVTFTKERIKSHVKYKVPESADDMGSFKDMGKGCFITYYTNQSSVYALYPYDDNVDTINKVTINGFNYETYKYVDKTSIHYVYRTKVNNDYHLFQYDVYATEYDDSQVEAFMNTVEFTYDEIFYRQ